MGGGGEERFLFLRWIFRRKVGRKKTRFQESGNNKFNSPTPIPANPIGTPPKPHPMPKPHPAPSPKPAPRPAKFFIGIFCC